MNCAPVFEQHRQRLRALAYRMIGSMCEAEDVVQDASLRWLQSDAVEVRSAEAWLVSVTTRLCIDRLRRLAVERAAYAGQWLPEPFIDDKEGRPDHQLELVSDLSMAFLIILERLAPEERAVFILHDVFDWSFADIAQILDKPEPTCRQMARRARGRVREDRPRFQVGPGARKRMVQKFLAALELGDGAAAMYLLADNAVLRSDGGGKVRVSARGIRGAGRIARLIERRQLVPRHLGAAGGRIVRRMASINGEPGIVTLLDDKLISTLSITTDGRRILAIYQMFNPEKLVHVHVPPPEASPA